MPVQPGRIRRHAGVSQLAAGGPGSAAGLGQNIAGPPPPGDGGARPAGYSRAQPPPPPPDIAPALKSYQDKLLQVTARNRSVLLRRTTKKNNLDLARLDEFGEGTAARAVDAAAGNIADALDGKDDEGARVRLLLDSAGRPSSASASAAGDAAAAAAAGEAGSAYGGYADEAEGPRGGADPLRSSLRTLKRTLEQISNETGQHTGYLGYPFLEGSPERGMYVRGPVVLFPMSIAHEKKARGSGWSMRLLDRRPILNRALFAALRKKAGYDLPEGYEDDFDEVIEQVAAECEQKAGAGGRRGHDGKAAVLFSAVAGWVSGLVSVDAAAAAADAVDPGPVPLGALKSGDIDERDGSPLRLVGHAVIGSFPQADSEIYRDYDEMMAGGQGAAAASTGGNIVGTLIAGHDGEDEGGVDGEAAGGSASAAAADIDSAGAAALDTVLESDSSQDEVIIRSVSDELCVVRGPPGTGKSQVIVNLIANALSGGRKVLVVCQKRAALEVVRQRLGRVGLAEYAVFIESEHEDRRRMYEQLLATIEADAKRPRISEAGMRVRDVSARMDRCVKFLVELGAALREPHFGGATAHKLYAAADGRYRPVLDIGSLGLDVDWKGLDELVDRVDRVEAGYRRFENAGHPWAGRRSFADMGAGDLSSLASLLDRMIKEAPGCIIAADAGRQAALKAAVDGYLAGGGLLGLKRRGHAKAIRAELGEAAAPDPGMVAGYAPRVEAGARMWGMIGELAGRFEDDSPARRGLHEDATAAAAPPPAADVAAASDGAAAAAPPRGPPEQLLRTLGAMREALDDFEAMRELDIKKSDYAGQGVFEILGHADGRLPEDKEWAGLVRQEVYSYWLDKLEKRHRVLRGDFVEEYGRRRAELADLMKEKQLRVIDKIRQLIDGAVDPDDLRGRARAGTRNREWMELRRELARKRRVMPVRRLFERYDQLLLQIAPCWLASPESVSRIFPLKRAMFDLVIVDEASQLAAERAMPFLYRARRAVVAGDEKQLPPFDLFRIRDDEDDDDEDGGGSSDDGEQAVGPPPEKSLLELAAARYGHTMLSWHYRSRYQDLINFSNHAFYAGMLNVAPNAASDADMPPVRWVKCGAGMWENNRNHAEANAVLDEVAAEWGRSLRAGEPYRSAGIITFNEPQQALIQDLVDRRRETDAAFAEMYEAAHASAGRDDALFVKNIENVQGDERDVIVFSIGYARNADGKFANRFGTLSQPGGENRLNVAVTRARQAMVVVSSIDPSDMSPTTRNEGPLRLRQFLEYARATDSSDADAQGAVIAEINPSMPVSREGGRGGGGGGLLFDSEFEVQVHTALEKKGHRVHTQVGFSEYRIDLAVVHPDDDGRYVVGIECDGASFHSARSVRERDVMRQRFLEEKGWAIERVWSSRWWRDRGAEIDRLDRRIAELVAADRAERKLRLGRPGKEATTATTAADAAAGGGSSGSGKPAAGGGA